MIESEKDFLKWLDTQLCEAIPVNIIAFNINIYETPFNIELLGSENFNPANEDWACNENWVPKNRMVSVSAKLFGKSWQIAENNIFKFATSYKNSDLSNVHKIKKAKAFAIGFVDGSLKYVY